MKEWNRSMCWPLGRNEKCESPSRAIAIGVEYVRETVNRGRQVPCVRLNFVSAWTATAARTRNKWHRQTVSGWQTPQALWQAVREYCRPKCPTWVIVHNASDTLQLAEFWHELDQERFSVGLPERTVTNADGTTKKIKKWHGMLTIDRRPFVIYCCSLFGTCKLIDIRNYYDSDIDTLAHSFGADINPVYRHGHNETVQQHEPQAVAEMLLTAFVQTVNNWRESDRGNWQPTAARLALTHYRHEFDADNPIILDNNKMNREFQRLACYGGEFNHWHKGRIDGPLYKVDVNSLYPTVMRLSHFPRICVESECDGSLLGVTRPNRVNECIAAVRLYGAGDLPKRVKGRRLGFPIGEFNTVLAGAELEFADKEDRIREWHAWERYELSPLFIRYVDYWWSIRMQCRETGNKAGEMLAKSMLNSLWGKFGQRSVEWSICDKITPPTVWGHFYAPHWETGKWHRHRSVAGLAQVENEGKETLRSFPAISAFVTASARMYMREVRRLLPAGSIISQQCDALLLTQSGFDALRSTIYWGDSGLGQLRLVDTYQWVDIRKANDYDHDHGHCISGLPSNATRLDGNHFSAEWHSTTRDVVGRGPQSGVDIKTGEWVCLPEPTEEQRMLGTWK